MQDVLKRAKRVSEIAPSLLTALSRGECCAATYVEMTAVDFAQLLEVVAPKVAATSFAHLAPTLGICERMLRAGRIFYENSGLGEFDRLRQHPSDTVRGWAAYLLAAVPNADLKQRLELAKPLADDAHFGVREWVWLALRPHIAQEIDRALELLHSWTREPSANLRRFAVESTRPRGFWSKHIGALKENPQKGLELLKPLKQDPSRYVQDSVGNWLNDAGKSQPSWVWSLCRKWLQESSIIATCYIARRATRSFPVEKQLGRKAANLKR